MRFKRKKVWLTYNVRLIKPFDSLAIGQCKRIKIEIDKVEVQKEQFNSGSAFWEIGPILKTMNRYNSQ